MSRARIVTRLSVILRFVFRRRCRNGFPAVALPLLLLPLPMLADAASFRHASSSNRIYIEGGGTATLSDIKAALPNAPLDLVDPARRIWLLRANLMIEDGSTLQLHGSANGGDVDELRLQSENKPDGFIWVSADHGSIDIQSTRITSWDPAVTGPDTEYANYGRAYIRVRSRLAGDGITALESRMDVVDSDIGYLGYYASEAYGLVWKVLGKSEGLYDKVQVRGNIINSRIHHNYFGVYTYGHQDGIWRDNEVAHNVKYGFDPHDDSDNLVIENNNVHDNGNHGIIASQRCDRLTIRNNRSWGNVGNGIMLHRSSNDSVVEGNEVYENTDSGIALFASDRNEIRANVVRDNGRAGIRLSMGAADNLIEDNEILDNVTYGLYFYRGSDTPNAGDDGRPKRNTFRGNRIAGTGGEGVKMSDGDENRFIANIFENNGSRFLFYRSTDNELVGNTLPSSLVISAKGTSEVPTRLHFTGHYRIRLELAEHATARFRETNRAIFDPDEALFTRADTGQSVLELDEGNTGGSTTVLRRQLFAKPDSSSVEVMPTHWDTRSDYSKAWQARSASSSQMIAYVVGNLLPGAAYAVLQGSQAIGSFTADAKGRISFSVRPGTTATLDYRVQPVAKASKGKKRGWYK